MQHHPARIIQKPRPNKKITATIYFYIILHIAIYSSFISDFRGRAEYSWFYRLAVFCVNTRIFLVFLCSWSLDAAQWSSTTSATLHTHHVMTSARRLVMDCISLRLYTVFWKHTTKNPIFFFLYACPSFSLSLSFGLLFRLTPFDSLSGFISF